MPSKGTFKDISGQKFGKLTAINFIRRSESGNTIWLFSCECGVQKELISSDVLKGHTKSCGCLRKDGKIKSVYKHGGFGTRLYSTWGGMHDRCVNISGKYYDRYGGRGIKLCDEWHDFVVFRDWALLNGYADNLTIDRIDNNGNYEPSNCKWSTPVQQVRNRRSTIWHEIDGVKKTLIEWCKIFNVEYRTAYERRKQGTPIFR